MFVAQDRAARSEIRRLEWPIDDLFNGHGTTLRDEPGIGTVSAATAKPAESTNATSLTASFAECGTTKTPEDNPPNSPIDKGASDRPRQWR